MNRALLLLSLPAALMGFDVSALSWMSGCWSVEQGSVTIEEQWNKPAGGQMMGISRTLRGGKVVFSEFMRIDLENGEIYYLPRIGASAAPVRFKLTRQSDTEVVFENPAHDFPRRILYRKSPDGLSARVDGMDKGKPRAEDFPMKSVSCK